MAILEYNSRLGIPELKFGALKLRFSRMDLLNSDVFGMNLWNSDFTGQITRSCKNRSLEMASSEN
jgi:hypothetical protein